MKRFLMSKETGLKRVININLVCSHVIGGISKRLMSQYVEDICFYRKRVRFVLLGTVWHSNVHFVFRLRYFDKMAAINHH